MALGNGLDCIVPSPVELVAEPAPEKFVSALVERELGAPEPVSDPVKLVVEEREAAVTEVI